MVCSAFSEQQGYIVQNPKYKVGYRSVRIQRSKNGAIEVEDRSKLEQAAGRALEAVSGKDILLVLLHTLLCCRDVMNLLGRVQIEILCSLPPFQPRHSHAGSKVGIQVEHSQDLLDTILMIDMHRFGRWNIHRLLGLAPDPVPSGIIYIEILSF